MKDEETKNHKEYDGDITTGFMPKIPDIKYCPIQSYLTYFYSLNKESEMLWQTPRYTNFPADLKICTWYGPKSCGHNFYDSFVGNLLKKCGLAEHKHTKHCLHVTVINTLKCHNYSNKDVRSVSGHKSSSSLEI